MRIDKCIVIGPMPPPVTGASFITAEVARVLSEEFEVTSINTNFVSSTSIFPYHFRKIYAVVKSIAIILANHKDYKSVYVPVDADWGMIYTIILSIFCRGSSSKLFLHHHSFRYLNQRSRLMSLLSRVAGREAHHIVLSKGMAEVLAQEYRYVKKTLVLSNVLFIETNAKPETESFFKDGYISIGHLSNLTKEKGLYEVLQIGFELKKNGYPFKLFIAGPLSSSVEKTALRNAKKSLGENLITVGPVYGAEKAAFLSKLDIFLFPTHYKHEAQPLVILEALSYGAFPISYARGCIPELLEKGGKAVPLNDDYISEALPILLTCIDDIQIFIKYKQAARKRFQELRKLSSMEYSRFVEKLSKTE